MYGGEVCVGCSSFWIFCIVGFWVWFCSVGIEIICFEFGFVEVGFWLCEFGVLVYVCLWFLGLVMGVKFCG